MTKVETTKINCFITAASAYAKYRNETSASNLQAYLKEMLEIDLYEYSAENLGFYGSLQHLVNILTPDNPLVWSVLDLLKHASRNPSKRQALIRMYPFASALSKLLITNAASDNVDQRLIVLRFLQEFTYGIKIDCQEAHLSSLFATLTKWIVESEEDVVTLSLEVLINFCYKNLPAIYEFMRTIETKALHKTLLKRQATNIHIRVLYCKLLIITEHTKNDIPDKIILDFVMMTFSNLATAYTQNDLLLLKHIVEFFEDVRQNEHSKAILLSYSNYAEDIQKVLEQLSSTANPECTAVIMDFLKSLVKLRSTSLAPLYLQFMQVALSWVPVDKVSVKALALIKTLFIDSRRSKIFGDLVAELDLPLLIYALENEDIFDRNLCLTELIQVLQELCKVPDLKGHIMHLFNEQKMRKLFNFILDQQDEITTNNWLGNYLENPAITLYIHALAMISGLTMEHQTWQTLFSELMRNKQIQMMIALALFTNEAEIKQKCLELMSCVGLPQECIPAISKYMSELEPLLLIQSKSAIPVSVPVKKENLEERWPHSSHKLISPAQKERIDQLLKKLETLCNENKITNITTSSVIELFAMEKDAMTEHERVTQASLEAADNRAASLQRRLALIGDEAARFRKMFLYFQQQYDDLQSEKTKMQSKLQDIEGETKRLNSGKNKEIAGLKTIVNDKSTRIAQLAQRIKEIEAESSRRIKQLEEDHLVAEENAKELNIKYCELKEIIEKLEASVNKKRETIENKEKEIEAAQENLALWKQENEQLVRQCRSYAQTISEKEEKIQKLMNEIIDLEKIRDAIYRLTANKSTNLQ